MVKIIVIRMRGMVNVAPDVKKTLDMLRLRKKFSCVIVDDNPETIGKLKKVQNYASYGPIKENTIKQLILKRAKLPGNKPFKDEKKVEGFVKDFIEGKKNMKELGIKPFFRLHPPRGGFKRETRKLFPKGILGNNKEINKLVLKML
ncbi:MAG: 50S ribosomal protein L30 [Candidatus Pacearchaeota archaeon]|nr:MAG: 50S ribosomal protein L30 [Candidatus Pacearchaeota archaeon]